MKIKLLGVINNMSLKRDGEYRIEFKFSFSEIANVVSTIRLLNASFLVGVVSEKGDKAVMSSAYFYRLAIDREGESRLVLSFSYSNIDDLTFFGRHQEELLTIFIKYGGKNEQ